MFKNEFLKIIFIAFGGRHVWHSACVEVQGQPTGVFSSFLWTLGIELGSSGLVVSPFPTKLSSSFTCLI